MNQQPVFFLKRRVLAKKLKEMTKINSSGRGHILNDFPGLKIVEIAAI